MAKDQANEVLARTSFLYGGNAAFIEDLYAKYQEDPASVDDDWKQFFADLKDNKDDVIAEANGPSWSRPDWPQSANGELVSALDSNWPAYERELGQKIDKKAKAGGVGLSEQQLRRATLDSVRALMLIRSYRIRGHLIADLDPLKLREQKGNPELQPESYGFGPEDMDRPIFIDNVLGLEVGTLNEIMEILKRTYCSTLGIEFMHISDPAQKSWLQRRSRDRTRRSPSRRKARRRSSTS